MIWYWTLFPGFFLLGWGFARAYFYVRFQLYRYLQLDPNQFADKERKRLIHYFYGTTYISVFLCCLRGKSRTRLEKYRYFNLSALAYYFDDLTDQTTNMAISPIDALTFGSNHDDRGMALHFLNQITHDMPKMDSDQFNIFLQKVYTIEVSGNQNRAKNSDFEQIKLLSLEKGGFSVLMFRRVLTNHMSIEEEEAVFNLGGLMQLADDIFDVWHDQIAHISTCPTLLLSENKVEELKVMFESQVNFTIKAIKNTPYHVINRYCAIGIVQFIIGLTRVCLDHYSILLKKHGTLPLHDRKTMVLDMGLWKNQFRFIIRMLRNK